MTLALILAALSAPAALAEQPPTAASAERPIVVRGENLRYNPNEIVCRSEAEVGSRLRTNRVCATRGQWAEHMREQRQNVEKAQLNRTY